MHRTHSRTISFTFLCSGLAHSQDLVAFLWDLRYSVIFTSCRFLFFFFLDSHLVVFLSLQNHTNITASIVSIS
ncbi:hypothetical protein H4582DRAFT_2008895 [Lactarius indigo]|nr:hypothetical protein H4582DRAFT_2008895 [Lactarius indigo]